MNHASGTEIVQTNLLATYFEKRINTFIKYFNSTKEHFGVEDLHKMRVEVKKLRAFFRLLELATEKSYQKAEHYKFLSKIFKPGGRLRETQINLSLIEKYTSYLIPYYKVYLIEREAKQKDKLIVAINDYHITELDRLNQNLLPFLEAIELNSLEEKELQFISHELETIESLRPGISNRKDLHKIRMHLKAMGYITKLLNDIKPDERLASLLIKVKPTETMIGNWHDRVVLALSLERFIRRNKDNPNKAEISRLIAQIEKKNADAVEEIGFRVDELLQTEI